MAFAWQLRRLGVDIIEAGFPSASEGEFSAVRQVAATVGCLGERPPMITALSRCKEMDILTCWDALKAAKRPLMHLTIPSSDLHIGSKLHGKSHDEVLRLVHKSVSLASSLCNEVELGAEDASRADRAFLRDLLQVAVAAGATCVNVPDTVGHLLPGEAANLVDDLRSAVPRNVHLSFHAHDDFGLATANALAAVQAGATQVELTVNGIGERSGNAPLEEVVMALHARGLARTNVQSHLLVETSRMLSRMTQVNVMPNKAIVGSNAFAHASGSHQAAIIKGGEEGWRMYSPIPPSSVGAQATFTHFTKHSGRAGLVARLEAMGVTPAERSVLDRCFVLAKAVADRVRVLSDEILLDLWRQALVEESPAREAYNDAGCVPYQWGAPRSSGVEGAPGRLLLMLVDEVNGCMA